MLACPNCGAELDDTAQFCGACGHVLPQPAADATGTPATRDAWQPFDGDVGHVTLTLSTACAHCDARVPVNGPSRTVYCARCQKTTPLEGLADELFHAARGETELGSRYHRQTADAASPQCHRCGESVSIDPLMHSAGATTTLPCAKCGAALPTWPAPPWLKEQLPGALQIFGGDPQVAKREAQLELEVSQAASEPIAMACPACGGGLTITEADTRTVSCTYCQANVFLPDELWRRLHPVKTMQRWTLTYSGDELLSAEEIARRIDEREEREALDERRVQEEAQQRAAASRVTRRFLALVIVIAVPTILYLFHPERFFIDLGGRLAGVAVVKTPAGMRALARDQRRPHLLDRAFARDGWTLIDLEAGRVLARRWVTQRLYFVGSAGDTLWLRDVHDKLHGWRTPALQPIGAGQRPPAQRRRSWRGMKAGAEHRGPGDQIRLSDHRSILLSLDHLDVQGGPLRQGPKLVDGWVLLTPDAKKKHPIELAQPHSLLVVHRERRGDKRSWIVSRLALDPTRIVWSTSHATLFGAHPARLVAVRYANKEVLLFVHDTAITAGGCIHRRRSNFAIALSPADGKPMWRVAF